MSCHPTLSYTGFSLPYPTPSHPSYPTAFPGAPSYPILQRSLLPSYLTSNPVLLYPTPYNHILPRPTLSYRSLLHPTSSSLVHKFFHIFWHWCCNLLLGGIGWVRPGRVWWGGRRIHGYDRVGYGRVAGDGSWCIHSL